MAEPGRIRRRVYIVAALTGFLAAAAFVLHAVFTSTSSTAAIGLLFLPVYALAAAALSVTVAYVGYTLVDVRAGRMPWRSAQAMFALAFVAAATLFMIAVLLYRHALAEASDVESKPDDLMAVSQRWLPLWREEVFLALAQNPHTPPQLLAAMAEQDSHRLVSLVGANPGTPLPVLEKIAAGIRNYERVGGLATNPRITPAIAGRLADVVPADFRDALEYNLYETFVLAALARNPATPQAVFDRLAARDKPEYFLTVAILYSDRASCAQIARIGDSSNETLRATVQSQQRKRGC